MQSYFFICFMFLVFAAEVEVTTTTPEKVHVEQPDTNICATEENCSNTDQALPTVLIIGGSRGIGLGIVQEYARLKYNVVATSRKPNEVLSSMENVRAIDGIDVTDEAAGATLAASLGDMTIDILIYNAGIALLQEDPAVMDLSMARKIFEVNVWGAVQMIQTLVPNVNNGGKIVLVSSCAASQSYGFATAVPHAGAYGMSKAALNYYGTVLAGVVKEQNIAVGMVHPGFVQTDLVAHLDAPLGFEMKLSDKYSMELISVEESVQGCVENIAKLNMENSPWYFSYYGATYEW